MVYIGWRNSQAPGALEDRVHRLEVRVSALTEALRVLAHGLEDLPATGPEGKHAAEAARQAYDLLLVADPPAAPREQLPASQRSAAAGRPRLVLDSEPELAEHRDGAVSPALEVTGA